MAKVLNTYEQADFERLAAFYPYRNEHGLQDMQQVLAQLRVENQQRNQDGEARSEQLRNDIAKDECAHALPDARFTDRLRRHAERATASAVSPAYTADADHTGNAAPLP